MFNISFWELCLVGVIGLLVLGPERLPSALRSAARGIQSIRQLLNSTKVEIHRQLELDLVQQKRNELLAGLRPDIQGYVRQLNRQNELPPEQGGESTLVQPGSAAPASQPASPNGLMRGSQ